MAARKALVRAVALGLILAAGALPRVVSGVAPVPAGAGAPAADVSAPVYYEHLMPVFVTKEGAAAVVFHDPDDDGVGYKFRYESADGAKKFSGAGRVVERRKPGVNAGYDETLLDIKAGPIAVRWSKGGRDLGWIYYAPEAVRVFMANARYFEDQLRALGPGNRNRLETRALDLKRFMWR